MSTKKDSDYPIGALGCGFILFFLPLCGMIVLGVWYYPRSWQIAPYIIGTFAAMALWGFILGGLAGICSVHKSRRSCLISIVSFSMITVLFAGAIYGLDLYGYIPINRSEGLFHSIIICSGGVGAVRIGYGITSYWLQGRSRNDNSF
jgi:hypothetical protein